MYLPPHFAASHTDALALIRQYPLGALVHVHGGGLDANHIPMAVASSSRVHVIEGNLNNWGLTHYFKALVSGQQVKHSKPDPEIFLLAAKKRGVPLYEYTPLQVKSAVTGYGQAEKPQVMEMTRRLLGLREVPKPDDTADDLAIAICHGQMGGTALKRSIVAGRRT